MRKTVLPFLLAMWLIYILLRNNRPYALPPGVRS